MTLVILGNAMGNRMVQDRFQYLGETVHRHVATVVTLLATVMIANIIKPVDPTFRCIGAIDGVHVPVVLLVEEQHPYRGRKGITTVNCMRACDFDMKFTFACVGKYYLVDSGYPMKKGFLAPYKGERYHIPNFQQGEALHHLVEKFNYLHSSLRTVIERTFGV
ncbi:hypothetical protein SO802_030406 [Lithocarpus litseifolius]|uniref:DDE Tnp4 domain-containing protein n=1 Tax=Lithocarpus litseifolius TaxID=425828 RepID=A0AAW2BN11_9ROSI